MYTSLLVYILSHILSTISLYSWGFGGRRLFCLFFFFILYFFIFYFLFFTIDLLTFINIHDLPLDINELSKKLQMKKENNR